jgi:hypothetical protein
MKDAYKVLQQKEADLARVRHEIESLLIVTSLLSDDPNKKRLSSVEKTLDPQPDSKATGTDGLFSAVAVSRPRFWKAFKRGS